MRVPVFMVLFLRRRFEKLRLSVPDEIIGNNIRTRKRDNHAGGPVEKPFLIRWFVIPKNKWCNVYLHQFVRDDEDRALHDHPWWNVSLLLANAYIEHTIDAGGVHKRRVFAAGDLKFRSPRTAHRVELLPALTPQQVLSRDPDPDPWYEVGVTGKQTSWSLFITGPVVHVWGFHCPESGWRSSGEFHDKKGCD